MDRLGGIRIDDNPTCERVADVGVADMLADGELAQLPQSDAPIDVAEEHHVQQAVVE